MGERRWNVAARSGLPWMVLGAALAWLAGGDRMPSALAQGPQGAARARPNPAAEAAAAQASAGGTIVMTSTLPGGLQMLYLVDTRAQSMAVYRVDPMNAKGVLKLEAQRQYGQDLRLTEFNNAPPEVRSIEAMVQALRPQ